ncbi:hypothetical protein H8959_001153 [Pygathrix nigripes]
MTATHATKCEANHKSSASQQNKNRHTTEETTLVRDGETLPAGAAARGKGSVGSDTGPSLGDLLPLRPVFRSEVLRPELFGCRAGPC